MLSPLQTTKKPLTVIEQNNALLANLSTALAGKPSEPLENCRVKFASQNNGSATVAALANSQNEQVFIGKSDFQELKDLLLDKIDSQNRHFDARIRGLAHRSQGQREEIPRSWTATLFLPVDKLAILQSSAPNAETQAHSHFLRNHIPLADLIISRIPVIINNEMIIAICHSKIEVN